MGDNSMRLESYEMLKALYDFKATFAKTLSFQEGDYFILYQTNTKQRNWWQVVNRDGLIGYIPSNYVTTIKVPSQTLLDFLEDCIKNVKAETKQQTGPLYVEKQDLLLKLIEKKRQAESNKKTKKQAPMPPDFVNTTPSKDICSPLCNVKEGDVNTAPSNTSYMTAQTTLHTNANDDKEEPPVIPQCQRTSISDQRRQSLPRQCSSDTQKIQAEIRKSPSHGSNRQTPISSPMKNKASTCEINSHTAYQLLDQVRRNTQLSYEMSKVAVTVVVTGLQKLLPKNVGHYFDAVLHQLETPFTVSQMSIEETYDANRLKVIFTELTSCKEDSQQRSWMLYEDECVIVDYIKELTSILTNADANVSRYILQQDQYNGVNVLIEYYQMEPRWTIRQLLLQSFGVMCSLDSVILTIMLNSVLPMELARDMRSNPRNVTKLNYSSLLLTMIFSMGEPMPVTHLEQLGPDFIAFALDLIENPPDMDLEDQISDLFVNLLLSYNLQFINSENIVLNALKERTIAKSFTEKILLLFNREEDPVRIFDHEPPPPHSVLKLFIDLFSNDITAGLFYTNDVKVLIDIILRQLYDMFPGDKRRQYLELCRRVLRTSSYNEHRYRSEDLLKCFTRIFCEETGESQEDQQSVREISNEFPHLFKM
ncbi:PREDICTED: NCK-interacting protein with SH3 domain isoform X2 [Dufourea novaeangliae]|uniref:NCK-interacting protein with SH3 domain n=1 Tax=Dufourea novaeangliae TaxID=178035 RepID=A0A154PQU3_DUFNO|nr:PREDICTED: NCK-interacting protein with SH3 domain isoform X2 [Dufourea novaeangliae]KZC14233.1 NCK-interacting protein with SH3 domain [Dufourea novaeangliae]